jgi:hypothetical protein
MFKFDWVVGVFNAEEGVVSDNEYKNWCLAKFTIQKLKFRHNITGSIVTNRKQNVIENKHILIISYFFATETKNVVDTP